MLGDRFLDLSRGRRRLLCCAAYGGFATSVPVSAWGSAIWTLLIPALCAISVASYLPLRAYLQGLDEVVLAEDYDDPDRVLATGREVDEKEENLRTRSLYHTRLILGMALVGIVVYAMLAAQFGLWRPDAPDEWGTSFLSCMWLVVATPTIVAGWLEKGTYGRSYSSWED